MFTRLCGANRVVVLAATLLLLACDPGIIGVALVLSAVVHIVVTLMLPLWAAPVPDVTVVARGGDDIGEAYGWTAGLFT